MSRKKTSKKRTTKKRASKRTTKKRERRKRASFVDAQAMHRKHPKKFEVPKPTKLDAIGEGYHVKVAAKVGGDGPSAERFWIRVTERKGQKVTGVVDNDLGWTDVHGLKLGDKVTVSVKNVYDVMKPKRRNRGGTTRSTEVNPLRLRDFTDFCEEVAVEYDRLPSWEEDEVWRWERLRDSIVRMFPQVQSRVRVDFVPGQPYDNAEEMRERVNRTGVLEISTDFNEHPFFTPEENLKFRAVHDYIVHIIPGDDGPDFTRRGELRAYDLHRKLAPVDTWPALFTEVTAQACYANARGEFPEQKLAVLRGFDFYNVGWQTDPEARAANPHGGWTVEKFEGVQLGYRTGLRGPGRGRKVGGYVISHQEHLPNGKHVNTRKQVVEYLVEQWDVPEAAANDLLRTLQPASKRKLKNRLMR